MLDNYDTYGVVVVVDVFGAEESFCIESFVFFRSWRGSPYDVVADTDLSVVEGLEGDARLEVHHLDAVATNHCSVVSVFAVGGEGRKSALCQAVHHVQLVQVQLRGI
jgi:hypothetical protein